MLTIYHSTFIAFMAAVSTATPTLVGRSVLTEGSLACVSVQDGLAWKVAEKFNHFGGHRHTEGDDVLKVKIDLEAAARGLVNIESQSVHPYFGAIAMGNAEGLDMGPSSDSVAMLGATEQTQPGAPPAAVRSSIIDGRASFVESAIWRYEPSTKQLKPQWVNHDGSAVDVSVFYEVTGDGFILTGNPRDMELANQVQTEFHECRLTFYPL